jgi:hypothetical protein
MHAVLLDMYHHKEPLENWITKIGCLENILWICKVSSNNQNNRIDSKKRNRPGPADPSRAGLDLARGSADSNGWPAGQASQLLREAEGVRAGFSRPIKWRSTAHIRHLHTAGLGFPNPNAAREDGGAHLGLAGDGLGELDRLRKVGDAWQGC